MGLLKLAKFKPKKKKKESRGVASSMAVAAPIILHGKACYTSYIIQLKQHIKIAEMR